MHHALQTANVLRYTKSDRHVKYFFREIDDPQRVRRGMLKACS